MVNEYLVVLVYPTNTNYPKGEFWLPFFRHRAVSEKTIPLVAAWQKAGVVIEPQLYYS